MTNQSLESWLKHIESFHPAEIELGLERIQLIAAKLSLLDLSGKKIIVGGTNGKGSCVAMLEAFALANDITVGVYTSPHLVTFNERIRLNGNIVKDSLLIEAFEAIEKVRGEDPLTFFEFTTLAALWCFKVNLPELIVLEVGLGGRLDAVNIIEPDVSVITTIDLDHTDWLGNTLEKVAAEKSGIARDDKTTYVGDRKSLQLLQSIKGKQNVDWQLVKLAGENTLKQIQSSDVNCYRLLAQNVLLARDAFQNCFSLASTSLQKAFSRLRIKGRFEVLPLAQSTIVDVAHNPQSARNLISQVKEYIEEKGHNNPNQRRVIAICGMMGDKAVGEVLEIMDPIVSFWSFVELDMPRAISPDNLKVIYQAQGLTSPVQCYSSVHSAYKAVVETAGENDLILVFGSFITVANMLQYTQTHD